jgi:hypothetical protein
VKERDREKGEPWLRRREREGAPRRRERKIEWLREREHGLWREIERGREQRE